MFGLVVDTLVFIISGTYEFIGWTSLKTVLKIPLNISRKQNISWLGELSMLMGDDDLDCSSTCSNEENQIPACLMKKCKRLDNLIKYLSDSKARDTHSCRNRHQTASSSRRQLEIGISPINNQNFDAYERKQVMMKTEDYNSSGQCVTTELKQIDILNSYDVKEKLKHVVWEKVKNERKNIVSPRQALNPKPQTRNKVLEIPEQTAKRNENMHNLDETQVGSQETAMASKYTSKIQNFNENDVGEQSKEICSTPNDLSSESGFVKIISLILSNLFPNSQSSRDKIPNSVERAAEKKMLNENYDSKTRPILNQIPSANQATIETDFTQPGLSPKTVDRGKYNQDILTPINKSEISKRNEQKHLPLVFNTEIIEFDRRRRFVSIDNESESCDPTSDESLSDITLERHTSSLLLIENEKDFKHKLKEIERSNRHRSKAETANYVNQQKQLKKDKKS